MAKDSKFITAIRFDDQGYSKRRFKSGRKWVRLKMDKYTKMMYIVEDRTLKILESKKFTGKNNIAFSRAAKVMLQKYLGHVFPKMRKAGYKLRGNVSPDWVK